MSNGEAADPRTIYPAGTVAWVAGVAIRCPACARVASAAEQRAVKGTTFSGAALMGSHQWLWQETVEKRGVTLWGGSGPISVLLDPHGVGGEPVASVVNATCRRRHRMAVPSGWLVAALNKAAEDGYADVTVKRDFILAT